MPDIVVKSGGPRKTVDKMVHIIYVPGTEVPVDGALDSAGDLTPDAELQVLRYAGQFVISQLEQTDVIVFAGQPWHFVYGHLHRHPQVHVAHPGTVLTVRRKYVERAVWWSDTPFTIIGVRNENGQKAVHDPFVGAPIQHTQEEDDCGRAVYVARATVHHESADENEFKISFIVGGESIDPNMDCKRG